MVDKIDISLSRKEVTKYIIHHHILSYIQGVEKTAVIKISSLQNVISDKVAVLFSNKEDNQRQFAPRITIQRTVH